jgi:hypothetical protein
MVILPLVTEEEVEIMNVVDIETIVQSVGPLKIETVA